MMNIKKGLGLCGIALLDMICVLFMGSDVKAFRSSLYYHIGMLLMSDVICGNKDSVMFSAVRYGTLKKRRRALAVSLFVSLMMLCSVSFITLVITGLPLLEAGSLCIDSLIILLLYQYMCLCVSFKGKALYGLAVSAVFIIEMVIVAVFTVNSFLLIHSLVVHRNISGGVFAVLLIVLTDVLAEDVERRVDL